MNFIPVDGVVARPFRSGCSSDPEQWMSVRIVNGVVERLFERAIGRLSASTSRFAAHFQQRACHVAQGIQLAGVRHFVEQRVIALMLVSQDENDAAGLAAPRPKVWQCRRQSPLPGSGISRFNCLRTLAAISVRNVSPKTGPVRFCSIMPSAPSRFSQRPWPTMATPITAPMTGIAAPAEAPSTDANAAPATLPAISVTILATRLRASSVTTTTPAPPSTSSWSPTRSGMRGAAASTNLSISMWTAASAATFSR